MPAQITEPLNSLALPDFCDGPAAPLDVVVDPLDAALTGPTTPPWTLKVGSVVELTFAAAA